MKLPTFELHVKKKEKIEVFELHAVFKLTE